MVPVYSVTQRNVVIGDGCSFLQDPEEERYSDWKLEKCYHLLPNFFPPRREAAIWYLRQIYLSLRGGGEVMAPLRAPRRRFNQSVWAWICVPRAPSVVLVIDRRGNPLRRVVQWRPVSGRGRRDKQNTITLLTSLFSRLWQPSLNSRRITYARRQSVTSAKSDSEPSIF